MSKKFLSDVLIECGLQVSGTTTLGTATATTVATSDNSTNIATTAFVKAQGYITTDSYVSNVSLNGNLLTFTGANSAFSGSIDLSSITSSFNASDVETVYERVKNTSGSIIYKGTPLAVVPGQTSGNISDVIPADASDPAKMPAVFIANEDIADQAEGEAVLFGRFSGVDTSLYQSGTTVYVAAGGGWTATKPVHPNLIQNLGVITKQHATNGGGIVTGVGRANALPNLTAGKIWVGTTNYPIESTTVHVDEANAKVGIGTTAPLSSLDVRGNISLDRSRYIFFGGEGSTGEYIYEPTPGTIAIHSGGSDSMVFPNSGVVYTQLPFGIGTTSPSNSKVHIRGNGQYVGTDGYNTLTLEDDSGYPGLRFMEGSNNWLIRKTNAHSLEFLYSSNASAPGVGSYSNRLTVLSSGNVGIGITTPGYKLDVLGSVRLGGTEANNNPILFGHDSTAIYAGGLNTNTLNVAYGYSGTYNMHINYNGYQGADTQYRNLVVNNGRRGLIAHFDGPSSYVGIGTASPSQKLHVVGNQYITGSITVGEAGADRNVSFVRSDGSAVGGIGWKSNGVFYIGGHPDYGPTAGNDVRFYGFGANLYLGSSLAGDVVTVNTSANVGISTTNPGEKLHVVGKVRIDSGSTSTTLQAADKTASPSGAIIDSYAITSTYGAFVDYVIYDSDRNNMRVGTLRAVWNVGDAVYTDVSTVDIGDTSGVTLTAVVNGSNVDIVVTGDSGFTIKASIKVIR